MIDVFAEAMKFTLNEEGGYSDDPNDAGGETYFGIARKYHPSWEGWRIIDEAKEQFSPSTIEFKDELTRQNIYYKINDFYKDNYWKPLQLDKVHVIEIAIKIFDMGVNLGVPRAASIVQNCLNIMSYGIDYEVHVDNIIGNITVNLINQMTEKDNGDYLLNLITLQQGYMYMRIATNNPTQKKYIHGWINRLHMNVKLI